MRSLPLPYRNGIRVVPCKSWPILFALCAQCGRDARDPINNPKCRHAGLEVGQPRRDTNPHESNPKRCRRSDRSGGPQGIAEFGLRIADCGLESGRSTKTHEPSRKQFKALSPFRPEAGAGPQGIAEFGLRIADWN
jgi:hypothetical protein